MDVVAIGGSQSTGSSLLRQILNRHAEMYCYNESHLFAKPDLYADFKSKGKRMMNRSRFGLPSAGWHIFHGVDLGTEGNAHLENVLSTNKEIDFEKTILELGKTAPKSNINILLDKTPANVFTIDQFLKLNLSTKVILTIRNPYDIIASLTARKMSLLDAVALVKSSFCAMNECWDLDKVHFVRYEDLIESPKLTVQKVCGFLNVTYFDKMLKKGNTLNEKETKINSWAYDETAAIGKKSIGRFESLDAKEQTEIKNALNDIQWRKGDNQFREIMERMDYLFLSDQGSKGGHTMSLYKSLLKRTVYLYPYNVLNNPISL